MVAYSQERRYLITCVVMERCETEFVVRALDAAGQTVPGTYRNHDNYKELFHYGLELASDNDVMFFPTERPITPVSEPAVSYLAVP